MATRRKRIGRCACESRLLMTSPSGVVCGSIANVVVVPKADHRSLQCVLVSENTERRGGKAGGEGRIRVSSRRSSVSFIGPRIQLGQRRRLIRPPQLRDHYLHRFQHVVRLHKTRLVEATNHTRPILDCRAASPTSDAGSIAEGSSAAFGAVVESSSMLRVSWVRDLVCFGAVVAIATAAVVVAGFRTSPRA